MPVYEYRCSACGYTFSKLFRSVAVAGDASCPACAHPSAERLLSPFAYHQSLKMQIESLDPKYEKEMDWAEAPHKAIDPIDRINLNWDNPDA